MSNERFGLPNPINYCTPRLLLPLAVLFPFASHAQECETATTAAELRELVGRAVAAIDEEDPEAHRDVSKALEARIPCLDGQMPSRPWADYLVTVAMIEYAEGTAWNQPLQIALDLVPNHPDIPPFMLEEFVPPTVPSEAPIPIPEGQVVVLDGRLLVGSVPPLVGPHVAQTVRDGQWVSVLLRGRPFPSDWIKRPDPDPPKVTEALASWGTVGVSGGFSSWGQRPPSDGSSTLLDDLGFPGAGFGVTTHGQQSIVGPVGAFWTADGMLQSSSDGAEGRRMLPFGSLFAGASLFDKPISIWLGGGVLSTRIVAPEQEKAVPLPHYLVGVTFRSIEPIGIDVAAGGGWGPWGAHFLARAGASPLEMGPLGLRFGGRLTVADATLLDTNANDRPVVGKAARFEAGLDVGISWGLQE